jgi:hypothetical protein
MIRAAKLDTALFEEVEADEHATGQATAVVLISSACAGLATFDEGGVGGLVTMALASPFSWYVWAGIIYLVGTRVMPEPATKADLGQLLRTIGFASSPGVLRILGVIPGLGPLAFLVAQLWILVATIFAVRHALDYSTTLRAIVVCVIGLVIVMMISLALGVFGAFV